MLVTLESYNGFQQGRTYSTCWKNTVRFFVTPIQKQHQGSGSEEANHFHIFWDCQVIRTFWKEIHKHIKNVFGVNIPFKCESMYLGDLLSETWNIKDKKTAGNIVG